MNRQCWKQSGITLILIAGAVFLGTRVTPAFTWRFHQFFCSYDHFTSVYWLLWNACLFFFFVFFLTWPNRTIILIGISLLFSLFFIFIFFARCILSSPLSFFTLCTHTHPFPYLSLMFIESCPPPPHTLSLSRIQRRLPPVWPDRRWEDLLQSVWGRDAGPRPEPSQCWGSQGSRQPQGWG